jgi:hypothetical protein
MLAESFGARVGIAPPSLFSYGGQAGIIKAGRKLCPAFSFYPEQGRRVCAGSGLNLWWASIHSAAALIIKASCKCSGFQ